MAVVDAVVVAITAVVVLLQQGSVHKQHIQQSNLSYCML